MTAIDGDRRFDGMRSVLSLSLDIPLLLKLDEMAYDERILRATLIRTLIDEAIASRIGECLMVSDVWKVNTAKDWRWIKLFGKWFGPGIIAGLLALMSGSPISSAAVWAFVFGLLWIVGLAMFKTVRRAVRAGNRRVVVKAARPPKDALPWVHGVAGRWIRP